MDVNLIDLRLQIPLFFLQLCVETVPLRQVVENSVNQSAGRFVYTCIRVCFGRLGDVGHYFVRNLLQQTD